MLQNLPPKIQKNLAKILNYVLWMLLGWHADPTSSVACSVLVESSKHLFMFKAWSTEAS